MSRFPSRRAGALAAAFLVTAATAAAQTKTAPGPPARVEIRDLVLEVRDLALETASLDDSLRRIETGDNVRLYLATDVLFDVGRARLTRAGRSRIAEAVREIRRVKPDRVSISAHSDSVGSASANRKLSRQRAESVRRAISRALGDRAPAIRATGQGESRPLAPNANADGSDNPQNRERNRRVEILVAKS